MKFFFADNSDSVDPGFDFLADKTVEGRNRRLDQYAHEVFPLPPYDGILVSRSSVEGLGTATRISQSQRYRIFRQGIRQHLRYPHACFDGDPFDYPLFGDCGAFSYIDHDAPPYSAADTLEFYTTCGFQFGVSPDHIITDSNPRWDNLRLLPPHIRDRLDYTMRAAEEFISLAESTNTNLVPIAPIQCWSPSSAARQARALVALGYDYLALGGIVTSRTDQIYDLVAEIRTAIPEDVRLHLFGFNRIDDLPRFHGLGITSFDSTAPILKSFKDDDNNYFSLDGNHYTALRIPPQNDSKTRRLISSGSRSGDTVANLENRALAAVRSFAAGTVDLETTVESISAYEDYLGSPSATREIYTRTLGERPWESCTCTICRQIGVEVMLYRGLNRHKRRGFHNLWVFFQKLQQARNMQTLNVPCLKIHQASNRHIYSFAVQGKDIQKFAGISRIRRTETGSLEGYQRPENIAHIDEIRSYLDKAHAILPNALIIAFNQAVPFEPLADKDGDTQLGHLKIPIGTPEKIGWIVDGQQRLAAIRQMKNRDLTVPVTAIETTTVDDEREQFVLINNTRPLPKSLVYELLPSIGDAVPPRFRRRQRAYLVLELLINDPASPFYQRVKTTTAANHPNATIKDVSVLKMIENSCDNGILHPHVESSKRQAAILIQYWSAVAKLFPDAWTLPPRQSRLTHGAGIVSMGYLMDTIAFRLRHQNRKLATHEFARELESIQPDTAWISGNWQLATDILMPWNEIQNTNRHIDLLTNYLIRSYSA